MRVDMPVSLCYISWWSMIEIILRRLSRPFFSISFSVLLSFLCFSPFSFPFYLFPSFFLSFVGFPSFLLLVSCHFFLSLPHVKWRGGGDPVTSTASFAKWLRRPPQERKIPGSIPACGVEIFLGPVISVTYKLALHWLPCQAPGIVGSALGLVGPVSVYCDWVR